MDVKNSVTELPFNSFLGIQTAAELTRLLQLPSGKHYLNHLGTVHASAQLALAEASSGEFLPRHFGSAEGIVPVVRRLEAKFRRPANGVVTSTAGVTPESLAQLDIELSSKDVPSFPSQWSFTTSRGRIRFLQQSNGSFNASAQDRKTI
jgi:hypothetical protein